ncbi:MAG: peptide chain release factor N(5)-glutamine methyltransferase [Sphingobium sp.]|nr:peptide chain release factor N(5)-glutamine methyltransferase [Sphingobium sp.]MCI1270568.1 peptide chain release factor N(5)-glutamine methyltransferase [Sphingobium sp.]MCI1755389.1 peptide chain release factor N(5)-glutamine methyltransferase [Sphingobium sp.]MCI2053195.1 peptide chain release factor N(5)-glutamine methyltransferase [Sphingobium sp.]
MSAASALREAAARLTSVSDTPRLDAELLMAHAAGLERGDLILRLRDIATPAGFAALIERRLAHEPVSHILGTRDFWTLSLAVTRDVLTPRPDSETLIEAALAHFAENEGPGRILDLGTGSGALLLAALSEWPKATGLGIDISAAALAVARANAQACGLAHRAEFRPGDWFAGIDEHFDLILANPPYIATHAALPRDVADYEPHLALFAGVDGLDAYRLLAPALGARLAPHGMAAIEIGYDQGESTAALFAAQGFAVTLLRDLAGQARCLKLTHV